MLTTIEVRTRIFADLLAEQTLDCAMIHLSSRTPCRISFVISGDRRRRAYVAQPRDAMRTVYRALDARFGRLVAAAGEDAHVVVLSTTAAPRRAIARFFEPLVGEQRALRFKRRLSAPAEAPPRRLRCGCCRKASTRAYSRRCGCRRAHRSAYRFAASTVRHRRVQRGAGIISRLFG